METEKKYPPKVLLKQNESAQLKLLRGTYFEGKNSDGPYYLYSVEHAGIVKSYFATAEIHQQIVAHKMKTGSEFILRRNGTKEFSFEPVHVVLPSNGNGKAVVDNLEAIMQQCVQEAVNITKTVEGIPFQHEDIRSISSCLFIARTKTNGHY
jgi:hypothetical protein